MRRELYHHKYLRKYRNSNGNWTYIYDEPDGDIDRGIDDTYDRANPQNSALIARQKNVTDEPESGSGKIYRREKANTDPVGIHNRGRAYVDRVARSRSTTNSEENARRKYEDQKLDSTSKKLRRRYGADKAEKAEQNYRDSVSDRRRREDARKRKLDEELRKRFDPKR